MKFLLRFRFCFIFLLCLQADEARSQNSPPSPVIKISGEVKRPMVLTAADLRRMPHATVPFRDRTGKIFTYSGVPVQALLDSAGATTGRHLRGENLTKYLMITCADGYEVLFSLAELDSSFTDRIVIVADSREGGLLPANEGPFRLIVPGEKKPARSGFQVVEMVVKFAKNE